MVLRARPCLRNRSAPGWRLRLFHRERGKINATGVRAGCDSLESTTMKKLITVTTIGVALVGFAACDSKVESSRKEALESKAEALDHKADVVRKDSKTDAADVAKQGALDADAAKDAGKARAEAEKNAAAQTAENVRKSGEQAAKALEEKAKDTREQK